MSLSDPPGRQVELAVPARRRAHPQLYGAPVHRRDLERRLARVARLEGADHRAEAAGRLEVDPVVPRDAPAAGDPAPHDQPGLALFLGARASGAGPEAQRGGELAVGPALVEGRVGLRHRRLGRRLQIGQARRSSPTASPPSDSRGAQRRTKRAAAAKVGNSHVRPAVNCSARAAADADARPARQPQADADRPAAAPAVGEGDRGRPVRAALHEQRVAAAEAHDQHPAAEALAVRARLHQARREPAARASREVQTPPATRQIPCRTAAATFSASAGGDPIAAAPATTRPPLRGGRRTRRRPGRRWGVGEAQPTP